MENVQVHEESASYLSGSSQETKLDVESGHYSNSTGKESSSQDVPTTNEDFAIAKEENKAVFRIRVAVAGFLTLCTVSAACLVYYNTKNQEQSEFENALYEFTTKVFGSMGTAFDQALAAIDAYVVASVSYSQASNMSWPFVTVPNSGIKLAKVLDVSRATTISIMPAVSHANLEKWNAYSIENGPIWVDENLRIQGNDEAYTGTILESYTASPVWILPALADTITDDTYYFPQWQSYPTPNLTPARPFNFDFGQTKDSFDVLRSGRIEMSNIVNEYGGYNDLLQAVVGNSFDWSEPVSEILYPIFEEAAFEVNVADQVGNGTNMAGVVWVSFHWRNKMLNMLPTGVNGIVVVVSTTQNTTFTYEVNGAGVVFMGFGDHHDRQYDDLVLEANFQELRSYASGSSVYTGLEISEEEIAYTFQVYPSKTFESAYKSNNPWIYTIVTVSIFVFTSAVFWAYDSLVERRQRKVMSSAVKSSAIVSSLFPSNVRDRLFDLDGNGTNQGGSSQKNRLKVFMNDSAKENSGTTVQSQESILPSSRPIADLFPEVTVMFADIAGFTAWSSAREPSKVFVLLECVYGAFDALAVKRGVFKVETIGDCYVAVAGLPDPRKDHAVVIAKFARDCCTQMQKLTARMSLSLGPDTEDLTMRFGLNSGPVTAGVLRGQKSRFQLFGDTVNTAARMESTGERNRIQVSQSTADELIKHKKGHWLHSRKDPVDIKGKGLMQTYWVNPREDVDSSDTKTDHEPESLEVIHPHEYAELSPKIGRLVDWNAAVLARLLSAIVARRSRENVSQKVESSHWEASAKRMPIDEVKEIIVLPEFDQGNAADDPDTVQLDPLVKTQLREYVAAIAATYHGDNNPFHNFEHASHVCMSVSKLMSRILAVDEFFEHEAEGGGTIESFKHHQTFGIASDPLTLFACAFAALIHDADHPGVPNTQVVKEGTELATKYGCRSVAEQRSVDLGWELLMEEKYSDLRNTICKSQAELERFRELVVNSVMATDIMDKELKELRNARWDKAFQCTINAECHPIAEEVRDSVNRKATIVIEHLIQASDVAHTMQHWHVFRKWNERLFAEMYQAYASGRAEKDPSEFWYKGELAFFDFYILPLAKKLSDCGVFGVSSDEYLNYAMKNREEWERKGEEIVVEMADRVKSSFSLSRA